MFSVTFNLSSAYTCLQFGQGKNLVLEKGYLENFTGEGVEEEAFENSVERGENALNPHFLPFKPCFSISNGPVSLHLHLTYHDSTQT